jgi:AraC-like DNA-binding protein
MVKGVPLATISESLGYKSIASFNKSFKNLRGQTPNQYLSQLKNKQ